jgi:large subunit ribosomal protein L6
MSRIGKLPIAVPAGVTFTQAGGSMSVKGPKGELSRGLATLVTVAQDGGNLVVTRVDDSRTARSNHGLVRALLNNMVTGVTKGFERRLEIQGVGFKAEAKGKSIQLALGYSHPIDFPFPEGITIDVDKGTKLVVKGCDRELVGETAAKLISLRAPDSYKGKGIRNEGQQIKLKAGKTAKK